MSVIIVVMEIVILGIGVLNVVLLLVIMLKKPQDTTEFAKMVEQTQKQVKQIDERMIRIEAGVEKITPKIAGEFRENRKEISQNFETIQRTVDTRVKVCRRIMQKNWKKCVKR